MPDDDRFADIGDALEADPDDDRDEAVGDDDQEEPDGEVDESPQREADQEDTGGAVSDPPSEGGPAFSFGDASQQSVYPRPETWSKLQAALSSADAELRTEHGIDDVEGRELHDAALEIASERPEELAERVAESRER